MTDKIYKHLKSGKLYMVLYEDAIIEASMTPAVVYKSRLDNTVWVRPKAEFFDGRFMPITEEPLRYNPWCICEDQGTPVPDNQEHPSFWLCSKCGGLLQT